MGRFLTRDTWEGDYNRPLSLNRWNYVEGNPINLIDPSGKTPTAGGDYPRHCQFMSTKAEYEACVLRFFNLEPINITRLGETVTGSAGCYTGPTEFRAPGYIEGLSYSVSAGPSSYMIGTEIVYDFATMQRQLFDYSGSGLTPSMGISDGQYFGYVNGFRTSVLDPSKYDIDRDYGGPFINIVMGITVGLGGAINGGTNTFYSPSDPNIRGETYYFGGSISIADLGVVIDAGKFTLNFVPWSSAPRHYFISGGFVDVGTLTSDIRSGNLSPLLRFGGLNPWNNSCI